MQYPLYNFDQLHNQEFKSKLKESISKIIDDGSFIEGKFNFEFEEKFAQMQCAKHCLLVGNGTDALEISLKALEIRPGDKVGVPALTFYATAEAVVNVGAIPVLVDVDNEEPLISLESLKRVHSIHNLKAIIPVHLYGLPIEMKPINNFCLENNIKIIEDGAQASGTFTDFGPVGSNPESLTIFSFYPTKNLSAMGDAGAILFKDDSMADKIKSIRNHGRGLEGVIGRNSRCDHFQAAVLFHKLEKIEEYNTRRKEVALSYYEKLSNGPFKLLSEKFLKTSSWHLFPLRFKNHEEAKSASAKLTENGIGNTINYYAKSMKQETALSNCEGEWTSANSWAGSVVCIPIHPFLTEQDINNITLRILDSFSHL